VNCKHINVRNALLKHVAKTVNYIIFDGGVILLNSFSPFFYEQDLLGRGSKKSFFMSKIYWAGDQKNH